jgi:hypothetical protein
MNATPTSATRKTTPVLRAVSNHICGLPQNHLSSTTFHGTEHLSVATNKNPIHNSTYVNTEERPDGL